MKYYYQLQWLIIKRRIEASGIPVVIGMLFFAVGYALLCYAVGRLPSYGAYLLLVIQQSVLMSLNHAERLDYLKYTFSKPDYRFIRVVEQLAITLPLLGIALYQSAWIASLILAVLPIFMLGFAGNARFIKTIPTPFYRKPFEFIQLFRRMWALLLLLFLVMGIALYYGNENLGTVLFCAMILLALGAYDTVEPDLYVWNYKRSAGSFLLHKCQVGATHLTLWLAPAILLQMLFNPAGFIPLILIWIGGLLLLLLMILMKYSVFPEKPGLAEMIMLFTAVITLIGIPYLYIHFYKKSLRQLKPLLC